VSLLVENDDSLPAILTIDLPLRPSVQTHVSIPAAGCRSFLFSVLANDSVRVVVTDSTAGTTSSFVVPFFLGHAWGMVLGGGPPSILSQGSATCPPSMSVDVGARLELAFSRHDIQGGASP
jgi:hypothetical protein